MTRYICVHGHAYQPPRENPNTNRPLRHSVTGTSESTPSVTSRLRQPGYSVVMDNLNSA